MRTLPIFAHNTWAEAQPGAGPYVTLTTICTVRYSAMVEMQEEHRIRTPDQRLRVFVSSTLTELADERAAVSRAVSALRLTPILFELGARPHPPRDLYRSYLAQSDIFIGLYWQRYGWIAPEMDISGLEDEYELSAELPRLLYVKAPAPDRDPALSALIERIEAEAAGCYRIFRTPRELSRLVRDDLAVLLSERFSASPPAAILATPATPPRQPVRVPAATTSLIGREREIDHVSELLVSSGVRLVTLTGTGGIGKTRLALAVADRMHEHFLGGVVMTPLASVRQPELVLPAVAAAAGVSTERVHSALDALAEHFSQAATLLVLDNLEQVAEVGSELAELLERAPALTVLATSRVALRLRAEHEYPVPPLESGPPTSSTWMGELETLPAVELFVDRARAVRHGFQLTPQNVLAVSEICRRLDGIPLAIELAAARTRLLEPSALLARLGTSLDALGTGPVDLPERQRTLRATVEWSIGLLGEEEAGMLVTLSVFIGGCTLEAVSHVCQMEEDAALDLLDGLARHSLLQVIDTPDGPRFRMLETIREYASERLRESLDCGAVRRRHAEYFRLLAERAGEPLRTVGDLRWAARLEDEDPNLRRAIRWVLANEPVAFPGFFQDLWISWWMRGRMGEVYPWVQEVAPLFDSLDARSQVSLIWTAALSAVELGKDTEALAWIDRLDPLREQVGDTYLEALSELITLWILPLRDMNGALAAGERAVARMREVRSPFMAATTTGSLGMLEVGMGRLAEARSHLEEAHRIVERLGSPTLGGPLKISLAVVDVMEMKPEAARALLEEGTGLGDEFMDIHRFTFALAAWAGLAFIESDFRRAALVLGAAEGLRLRVGLRAWPVVRLKIQELVRMLERAIGPEEVARLMAEGAELSRQEALAVARSSVDPGVKGRRGD
jgi:predicted ATPase